MLSPPACAARRTATRLAGHVRNIAADSVKISNEDDRRRVIEKVEQTLQALASAPVAA